MAAKKAPAKKMAAPAKAAPKKTNSIGSATAAEKRMMDAKATKAKTTAAKDSKYNKVPAMNKLNPKADKKSQAGDLASERATLRQAAQLNRGYKKQAEKTGIGFLAAVTYRDINGKLKNTVLNRARSTQESPYPKSNYFFMGDTSKKKKK
jgi:hypothetical protein